MSSMAHDYFASITYGQLLKVLERCGCKLPEVDISYYFVLSSVSI
ncbi:unnamed protein product [Urochloa humidicola]